MRKNAKDIRRQKQEEKRKSGFQGQIGQSTVRGQTSRQKEKGKSVISLFYTVVHCSYNVEEQKKGKNTVQQ